MISCSVLNKWMEEKSTNLLQGCILKDRLTVLSSPLLKKIPIPFFPCLKDYMRLFYVPGLQAPTTLVWILLALQMSLSFIILYHLS